MLAIPPPPRKGGLRGLNTETNNNRTTIAYLVQCNVLLSLKVAHYSYFQILNRAIRVTYGTIVGVYVIFAELRHLL